ncbi:MAG: hypothetical protein ABI416_17755 [Ginsengibacter sp.]
MSCLLYEETVFAQHPEITTSVDKRRIIIGEQIHYKVSTSMPDNTYRLSWFIFPDSVSHFQVVRQNNIDSSFINGYINFSQDITLTSFDSGLRVIPSFVLNVEPLRGDTTFNLLTDSIPVQVLFSPMDSVKTFHDIKSIIEVKKEWAWWLWVILAVAVLLLIVWIRFLIKFLKKKPVSTDLFSSKLLPYEEAMQLLADLQQQQLLQKSQVKEYHTKLSEIIKRYLSRKTKTYKMNLTSDEILMELDEYTTGKEQVFAFANCLRMSSAVKFAKYIPPDTESEKCLAQTREMITVINQNLNKKAESGT